MISLHLRELDHLTLGIYIDTIEAALMPDERTDFVSMIGCGYQKLAYQSRDSTSP